MIDALDSPLVDRETDKGPTVAYRLVRHATANIAKLVIDKVLDGLAPNGCVSHQFADEPEASRVAPLPDQKGKMRAFRSRRACLLERSRHGKRDRILRIVERAEVEPNPGRNFDGIDP